MNTVKASDVRFYAIQYLPHDALRRRSPIRILVPRIQWTCGNRSDALAHQINILFPENDLGFRIILS